jgi:hypothetical protein
MFLFQPAIKGIDRYKKEESTLYVAPSSLFSNIKQEL